MEEDNAEEVGRRTESAEGKERRTRKGMRERGGRRAAPDDAARGQKLEEDGRRRGARAEGGREDG